MGNGNIFVPLDRVEELENRIKDVPLALLNGSWVREEDENGNLLYYRQDVEVKGLSADSTPMIFPKWAGEEPVEEELNAYDCLIGEPIITEGNIRFMANPMPQWSFTMVAKGAMASEGQDIDAVAGLVAKMNELETEVDGLNRKFEYSTEEQVIGTWINGKPLYRKVLHYDSLTIENSTTKTTLTHNIGMSAVVNASFSGSATWTAGYYFDNMLVEFKVNSNNIIMSYHETQKASFTNVNIILEYTK